MQRSPLHFRPWGKEVIGFFAAIGQEWWRVPADLGEKHRLLEERADLGHVSDLKLDIFFCVLQNSDSFIVGGLAKVNS